MTVKSGPVILIVAAVMLVGSVYNSSSTFLFVEGFIKGEVTCSPQGGGKTYCCATVAGDIPFRDTTYCTTCDDTNPPSNCTPREKPKAVVNPGRDLSNILEGGVLEEPTTFPNLSQKFGEILQAENNLTFSQANISSDNSSNNTLALEQSDLASDTVEKTTRNVDDGQQEQDESGTTEEGASAEVDEAEEKDKNDEEESPP